ncbi:unnamed protein product [Oikopleura dioica]|uniref:ZP domain-containing protein n=1 Tax=Oikopleura dioica TaxID=34765 RepID=E4XIK5_OIKDI|nr:unnamed protein product [Oikopleura dioica]
MKLLVGLLVAKASADFELSCWQDEEASSYEGSGGFGDFIVDYYNNDDGTFTIESGQTFGECSLLPTFSCSHGVVVAATDIDWNFGEGGNVTCNNSIRLEDDFCSENFNQLYQWNGFAEDISFMNSGEGNQTITFEYMCYEDLVPQPECEYLTDSVFGPLQFNSAEIYGAVSANSTISPNPALPDIESMYCAQQCAATAGCYGFSEDDSGCLLSSSNSHFDGAAVGQFYGGKWDDYCPNPNIWSWRFDSEFFCLFRTSKTQQEFVDDLNARYPGGIHNGFFEGNWNGVNYAYSYSYEFEYFAGEPSYADRFNYGDGYIWVGFKFKGDTRFGRFESLTSTTTVWTGTTSEQTTASTSYASTTAETTYSTTTDPRTTSTSVPRSTSTIFAQRRRRQVNPAADDFQVGTEELTNVIQTVAVEIEEETATTVAAVDSDATLEQTGDVESVISTLSATGEVTGTCNAGTCECNEGNERADDGSCAPILVTDTPINEDPTNPTTPPPTLDCDDGNNGGCSHFCNQDLNICECPGCWMLRDDNAYECTPDPANIFISCEQSAMSLILNRCIYSNDVTDEITLSFKDNTCESLPVGSDQFDISTGLDECSTSINVDGDEIVFDNTIMVKSRVNNHGIVMNSNVNIDVQCRFSSIISDVSSSEFTNSPATQEVGTTGSGVFQFEASFYDDEDFDSEAGPETEQMVGEAVFFGLSPSVPVEDLTFIVNDCSVTDGTNSFPVYEDGCPNSVVNNDAVTQSFLNSDSFHLSYTAFQFSGNSELQSMEMHCSLYVCMSGVCPVNEPTCD